MIIIGLTGSIATGKTTVANMFSNLGAKIFNADEVMHEILQSPKGIELIKQHFSEAIIDNKVNRNTLRTLTIYNLDNLYKLEKILMPFFYKKLKCFLRKQKILSYFKLKKSLVVLDIPLLFEYKLHEKCNYSCVVICSEATQISKVLQRKSITIEELNKFIERQLPQFEKIQYADFVINTEISLNHTCNQVKKIIKTIQNHKKAKNLKN